jgi:hypothetical protein
MLPYLLLLLLLAALGVLVAAPVQETVHWRCCM